jgi:hypothetical protein
MLGWLASSFAQQPAVLVSEGSDLEPCLDNEACNAWFNALLSETMVEYGFMFQHDAIAGGALAGKGNGFVFEFHIDSAALGPPNLVGENVRLPPILPRLEIGWQVGSFTFDDPYPQFAVSLYAFPPIKAGDSGAFSAGGSASVAVPLGTHLLWGGGEIDVAWGGVHGPMIGDGDAIGDIDLVTQFVEIGDPPCDSTEEGCIDRYRTVAPTARLGLSFEPTPPMFFYGKVGAAWIHGSLDVAYDSSRWVIRGLQPQVSYGGGIRLGDRVQLGLGGVTALKPAAASTDDSRRITRIVATFAIRMGAPRYWERDAQPEPPAPAPEPDALQGAP